MSTRTAIARNLRKLGLSAIVDSSAVRSLARAPQRSVKPASDTDAGDNVADVGPLLTVVVPAYNVEQYLSQCLDSILSQSYTNLDVLIVNDGSTDGTASLCDQYASKHKRVRVIHKTNAGLGAARNTGLSYSSSEFITFVDSDDVVPPGAYERAMNSLSNSGSDVCIAAVSRFDSRNKWKPFWVDLAHDEDRYGISGSEFPPIMWDVFAWNKVYRRDTWDRLVGNFPEGTLYEDQECTAKLFVGDAKLDVLRAVGYNWRLRDDNTSITQQKTSIDDLRQRLDVALSVLQIVDQSNEDYRGYWFTKTLGEDLYYYIREVPRASDEFHELLSTNMLELWKQAPESSLKGIEPTRRILAYTAAHCSRSELVRLLVHLERTQNAYQGFLDNGHPVFRILDFDQTEFQLPESLREVATDFLKPRLEITSYLSDTDGDVTLRGYGFIPNYDIDYGYSADLFDGTTDSIVATLVIGTESGAVPPQLSDTYHSYSDRRFVLRIPHSIIDDVANQMNSTQSGNLQLRIHLHVGRHSWTVDRVRRDIHSSAGYPGASHITKRGSRVAFYGDPRQGTDIIVLRPRLFASAIVLDRKQLRVDLKSFSAQSSFRHGVDGFYPDSKFYLTVSKVERELARSEFTYRDGVASATLVVPENQFDESKSVDRLHLHVVDQTGKRWAIAIDREQATRDRDSNLAVATTGYGYAVIDRPIQAATASSLSLSPSGRTMIAAGTYVLDPTVARTVTPTFALVGSSRVVHPIRTEISHSERTFKAEFPLTLLNTDGYDSPLEPDRYILQLLLASGKAHPAAAWVTTSYKLEDGLPEHRLTTLHSVTLSAVGTSRSLRIDLSEPLSARTEAGKFNQTANATVFLSPTRTISPSTILFESFAGAAVADSPLALDREIALKYPDAVRLWTVKHPLTPVPSGAEPVVFGSQKWYDAVSSAKILINNNNFPHFFRKRSDQFYVQTWHGTPLKRIGNHVPPKSLSLSYRDLMTKEAERYWDLMIAQSPWAAETLRDAFNFEGHVLDLGYPRNDVLANPDQLDVLRHEARLRLGLNPDQRVILYAPTWRDNLKERSGHYSSVDFLNVNKVAQSLGTDTIILYRGHSNSLSATPKKFNRQVIDVSRYPDINFLIAASDTLVTDYSSIMFDYVVTGKPIVFVCPDLEEYRDSVRGFYFEFEATAPGPVVKSSKAAIDLLKSARVFSVDTTERYLKFRELYAGHDDGYSSTRVVQELAQLFQN